MLAMLSKVLKVDFFHQLIKIPINAMSIHVKMTYETDRYALAFILKLMIGCYSKTEKRFWLKFPFHSYSPSLSLSVFLSFSLFFEILSEN